ncbi:MAG: MotA/TolQ/ExbB proton channel family protein [Marinoscillum sp.]
MIKAVSISTSLSIQQMIQEQEAPNPLKGFHNGLKERFLEGGWEFMMLTLICLVLGLVIFIKKLFDLNANSQDNLRFLEEVEKSLQVNQGLGAIPDKNNATHRVCSAGIEQIERGFTKVQETIEATLSVERGKLMEGLTWISLFISLAPMLGFMGTVLGMIQAFDAIATIDAGGNMSPALVADGIKVALITTVSGLVIAVILQLLYNYLVNKVEIFMTNLEETSSTFIDLLIIHQLNHKS